MRIKENRRAARTRHDSVLEFYDDAGCLLTGVMRLIDVSSTGASFATTSVLAKGARIRGRLRLLGVGVLDVTGRVVRVKERNNDILYGVAFDSETPMGNTRSTRMM